MFIGRWSNKNTFPVSEQGTMSGNVWHDSYYTYTNGRIQVCFWGTLYNKVKLGYGAMLNHAEIIAHLYDCKGYQGFSLLDGSFTMILQENDSIIIVRDHHGTNQPVYYTDTYFASSLSLLRQTENCPNQPDYRALSSFLTIGYIATPSSSFAGIQKLGAGEILISRNGQQVVKNLYPTDSILPVDEAGKLDELSEQYGVLHSEAIKKRIGTSNNVGILLSGGYDSGCNLAALRKLYNGNIHSFSIGFKGDSWTELPLARCMSDTFHTIHSEYEIDGSEIAALPDIVEHLGDPFVEGGLMVNYAVMRMIGEKKPDVILGGDGSDQYFGTSGREVALHYLLAKSGMQPLLRLLYTALNSPAFDKNNKFYRIRFHLDKILHILQGDLFGFPEFRLKEMVQDKNFLPVCNRIVPDTRSFAHLYTQHAYKSDVEKIINQVILFKASGMASLFNNTIAFPYMDLDLYHFLMLLPVMYKCKGANAKEIAKGHSTAKFLLKYHYTPMLPELITAKKKQGGFAPMPLFFKDDRQRARIADYVMSSSMTDNYLKRSTVESFIKQYEHEVHASGNWFWYKQNKAIQYFNLLALAVWWERFVDGKVNTNVLK